MKTTIIAAQAALVGLGGLLGAPAHAGLSVGAGTEYMQWREYHAITNEKLLEESGPRFYATVGYSAPAYNGIEWSSSVKLYTGQVQYDGAVQNLYTGTITPVTSTTDYDGASAELQALFTGSGLRRQGLHHPAIALAVGLDSWRRKLNSPDGFAGTGYVENYRVPYVRIGLQQGPTVRNPWFSRLGVLRPFAVREEVSLGLVLEPDPQASFYLYFGKRLARELDIEVGYQGYRFAQSPSVAGGWYQPKSQQDLYSATLRYRF